MPYIAEVETPCARCPLPVKVGELVRMRDGIIQHEACIEERAINVQAITDSHAHSNSTVEVPAPEGLAYLPYQLAAIAYAMDRARCLIADDMGLGKTVQALGLINALSPGRVLIICPASLIDNWMREIDKWVFGFARGLGPNSHMMVVSYEKAKSCVDQPYYDLLIVDEAHYCKTQNSNRTKTVQQLARNSKRMLLLTGTPMVNRPVELWSLLQMLAPEAWDPAGFVKGKRVALGHGAGFFKFALRYCNARKMTFGEKSHWDFTGHSNEEELQNRLRSTVMVRRLKKDVLQELPSIRRQLIVLKGKPEWRFFLDGPEHDYDSVLKRLHSNKVLFEEWSRIRETQGIAKVQDVVDYVERCLEQGVEKLILFCHHRSVLDMLFNALQHHGVVTFHGGTPMSERQDAVDVFQDDPNCRIFLGTIKAAGVGITLTAASHLIFAELDPTPGAMNQAEARPHRIGQKNAVFVDHLVIDGTLDARMCRLLIAKQAVSDRVLDV